MNEKIKAYWDERAKSENPTTNDVYLRELEIKKFVQSIALLGKSEGEVLDMGCGDGYSTLRIAAKFHYLNFTGIDYSESMIAVAQKRLSESPDIKNVTFKVGSVEDFLPAESYDIIMTDRCLINLDSPAKQYSAIVMLYAALKPKGVYFAVENFQEGQEALNKARACFGLPAIEMRWHNRFFVEEELRALFPTLEIEPFSSSYYFATRVVYSALCKVEGIEPDYRHPIHKGAVDLPPFGDCSPIKFMRMRKVY